MDTKTSFIPVAMPVLDRREADAAAQCILSGWVTQGKQAHAISFRVR